MDVAECRERVTGARVARLGTLGDDGRAHLVPIVFALADDTIYSAVDDKPKRTRRLRRLANIRRDPRVTVLVDHYDDDWSLLWWVRVEGEARILERPAEVDVAAALLAAKYPQYHEEPILGPVIEIACRRWSGWRAS